MVFDYLTKSAKWADFKEIDWEFYFRVQTTKLLQDLPVLYKSKRGFIRAVNKAIEKWLIKKVIVDNTEPYYKLTEKWKERNTKEDKQPQGGVTKTTQGVTNFTQGCDKNDIGGVTKTTHNPSTNNTSTNPSNKEKEKNSSTLLEDKGRFDEFRSVYPRKKGKAKSKEYWCKLVKKHNPDDIISWARKYALECKGKEAKYIKRPQGWLNENRWIDYLEEEGDELDTFKNIVYPNNPYSINPKWVEEYVAVYGQEKFDKLSKEYKAILHDDLMQTNG